MNKFKKAASVLLALLMIVVTTSCQSKEKKAFSTSKQAYDQITKAYKIADVISSNLYEAWRLGVYEREDLTTDMLLEELNLSEDELIEGVVCYFLKVKGEDYTTATDTTIKEQRESAEWIINRLFAEGDDVFQWAVNITTSAHIANGDFDFAKIALKNAKSLMKELSEKHSDYEHYPNLKGYFTSVSALLDFCESPEGSFEQLTETTNKYSNEIRDYQRDLDYIFED